jgi:hypothetical protein
VSAMLRPWRPWLLYGLAVAAALSACEWVAGIEDKELVATRVASSAKLPARPDGDRTPSGKGRVVALAAREYFFGTRRVSNRQSDERAWQEIGFDLDGLCTKNAEINAQNPSACQLNVDRQPSVLEDGDECRDNSFGRNVSNNAQITQSGDLDNLTNDGVETGVTPTFVLVLEDYDDGDDDPYVPATLYLTESAKAPDGGEQLWDENTVRTVAKGKYSFPTGYRRGDTWVAGDAEIAPRLMPFVLWQRAIETEVQMAVMSLRLRNGGRGGAIGTVGFAVDTKRFGAALTPLIVDLLLERRFENNPTNCGAAASFGFGIVSSVGSYVDLARVDQGNKAPVDNSAPCSLLSMGFAFEAVPTQPPPGEGQNPPSPQRVCPDILPPGPGGAGGEAGAAGADGP